MFEKTILRNIKHCRNLDATSKWFLLGCAQHTDNASTVPRVVGMYYATLLTAAQGSKYTLYTLNLCNFPTWVALCNVPSALIPSRKKNAIFNEWLFAKDITLQKVDGKKLVFCYQLWQKIVLVIKKEFSKFLRLLEQFVQAEKG